MLTREEILSSFKQVDFPDKLIDKSITSNVKNIIFYKKSSNPSSEKAKNTQKLSESYVIPRHILIQKNNQANQTHKNEFNRSSNFTPKEALIDIKIDNFKLIYDKYTVPTETNIIYLKNTYGGVNGPYNLEQIKNLYKNKKIDSNTDFRTIDIFTFKNSDLFSFQSIKLINDEKWIDSVVDNSLINFCDLYKNKKEENLEKKEEEKIEKDEEIIEKEEGIIVKEEGIIEKEEIVKEEKKIKESEGNWEVAGKKKKKVKSKEIKEKETKEKEAKEVKEEKKNIKKEDDEKDSLEQLEMKLKNEKKEDDLIEILKKKKMEKERLKQKEEEHNEEKEKEDVKEVKKEESRIKKGKKKKKNQFAETEIDVGFVVK